MKDSEREEMAKKLITSLGLLQESPSAMEFPCPRCGRDMDPRPAMNALSRRAEVYICSTCGMDEALRDITGAAPIPFSDWAMVKAFFGGRKRKASRDSQLVEGSVGDE